MICKSHIMRNLLMASLMLFMFSSCTEDDITPPEIVISSPETGAEFSLTDDILLVGRITDEQGLQSVRILSENLGIDETINTFEDEGDFPFNFNIVLDDATAFGSYILEVIASDKSDNVQNKSLNIFVIK